MAFRALARALKRAVNVNKSVVPGNHAQAFKQQYGGAGGGMGASVGIIPLAAAQALQSGNANVGAPQQGTRLKPSDQRFRSFAERFMIARAHLFRADPEGLTEDTWVCVMDAKRAYAMIKRVGQNIEPEDGAGF